MWKERDYGVMEVPVDNILPNHFQPRTQFSTEELEELATSIKNIGVIQPIIVRRLAKDKFELIAGERRWRAAKMAGLQTIPAIVRDVSEDRMAVLVLVENLQRKDLNCIEEARGYQTLINELGLTQEELSKHVGKSQSAISNKLRLLTLPAFVQDSLMKEEITERHARELLKVKDEKKMFLALKTIKDNRLSVAQTEKLVSKIFSSEFESAETPIPLDSTEGEGNITPLPVRRVDRNAVDKRFKRFVDGLNKIGARFEYKVEEGEDEITFLVKVRKEEVVK
ncbi:MAG: ParB/RepB/Spo0J family partition protein [Synergistetes bacterium]|nr:ParB/RepB/Spo0J family partition protein [Synergistota bacterium]